MRGEVLNFRFILGDDGQRYKIADDDIESLEGSKVDFVADGEFAKDICVLGAPMWLRQVRYLVV